MLQNFSHNYRPQRSCGQGNVFTPVCHSVHWRGVCLSACWDTTPPGSRHPLRADTPWEQTPPQQTPPRSRHPWEQTPPESRHPPRSRHPPSRHPPGADTLGSRHPPWSRHPPGAATPQEQTPLPPGSRFRHTVNERPVRILLECILLSSVHFV